MKCFALALFVQVLSSNVVCVGFNTTTPWPLSANLAKYTRFSFEEALLLTHHSASLVLDNVSEVIQQLMHNVNDEDHQAHHIFCEMDVLHREGEAIEWKESAR